MNRPLITQSARPAMVTIEAINEHGETVPTAIAGEHPLTVYVDKCEVVTLMTLGSAPEALAIGYLRNQRLVSSLEEIATVQVDWETDAVALTTRRGIENLGERMGRRTVTTGCGQGTMFGDLMDELDRLQLPDDALLEEDTFFALLDQVRRHESIYKQAGAVHGCALATNQAGASKILHFVEDVGRHNAVDAIAGLMWLEDMQGGDKLFYTTGRLTSEMVIKAAQMGIPFLISRSGLTQMGYDVACRVGMTMIGRSQGKHYLIYTGSGRFIRRQAEGAAA
jgi:FdhD protein